MTSSDGEHPTIDGEPADRTVRPTGRYQILRLNQWSEKSWAVIDGRTGAIVSANGKLLMRMSKEDAATAATAMCRATLN